MKRLPLFAALCLALPLCAAKLVVNAPATDETLTNDQMLSFDKDVTVAAGDTVIVSATLTMTLPSDTVDQSAAVEGDKLVVTADVDGSVLVYAGGKWHQAQGLTVKENDTLDVSVEAKGVQGAVKYVVTLKTDGASSAVETGEVSGRPTFSTVVLAGEGEATGLAVAAVPQGILPPSADGAPQDAELVGEYVKWLNDPGKGGAMKGATETEISDAFAMNVGGKPSLTITDITPPEGGKPGSITVAGSYVPVSADGTALQAEPAPLDKINGTLYITYASELGGKATTEAKEISAADGETKTITLPKGAIFVKARVALTEPDDETL